MLSFQHPAFVDNHHAHSRFTHSKSRPWILHRRQWASKVNVSQGHIHSAWQKSSHDKGINSAECGEGKTTVVSSAFQMNTQTSLKRMGDISQHIYQGGSETKCLRECLGRLSWQTGVPLLHLGNVSLYLRSPISTREETVMILSGVCDTGKWRALSIALRTRPDPEEADP